MRTQSGVEARSRVGSFMLRRLVCAHSGQRRVNHAPFSARTLCRADAGEQCVTLTHGGGHHLAARLLLPNAESGGVEPNRR
eukprot:3800605-Pleurochrysis_carterae.AAC.1